MNIMKTLPVLTLLAALALATLPAGAADNAKTAKAAKAKPYPLKTCLVSGESLGSMGEAAPYIHRVKGQPDRIVFVCCEGCIDDFKADPAKFLKKVDDAAKAQAAAKKS